jgi:hypothetical protein
MTQSPHRHIHHRRPILHIVHDNHTTADLIDRRVGQVDLMRTSAQVVSGERAFRNYAALANRVGSIPREIYGAWL